MNREVKVIIPNMREFRTFYSDNEGVIGMFFKIDWVEVKQEEPWKPSEEQMEALNEIINILAMSMNPHENEYLFNILNGLKQNLKKL